MTVKRKDKIKNQNKKPSSFARLLSFGAGYRVTLIFSVAASVVISALALTVPVLVGRAIDCAVAQGSVDFDGIFRLLCIIAGVVAVYAVLGWAGGIANNRAAFGVVSELRRRTAEKLTRLPLSYLDSHSHGELLSRVSADAEVVSDGLLLAFTNFASAVATIIGALALMFVYNPIVAAIVVALTPASLFIASRIARSTYSSYRRASEERGEQTRLIEQYVTNRRVVAAFSREERVCSEFDAQNDKLSRTQRRAIFFSSLTNPSTRLINNIIYAVIAAGGAFSVIARTMSVGGLTTFLAYSIQYTKPLNEISGVIAELQNAAACAGRLFELLDAEEEEAPACEPFEPRGGFSVDFNDVSFSYKPDKPLIQGLNLHVRPGEHIAIVGPTGCGKTTLINLLMRFYDVGSGALTLNSRDVRDMTRSDLRRRFGMVLQDTWLAHGTVAENIAYGKPDATREEIVAAAKAAHAGGFISRLPEGYDTVIGGDDDGLSGGQRQLLCIARVMLCDPEVLILDEATSSVDTATEHRIQAAFERLCEGRTSFIVAHRLSTIRGCDRILVMRDGNIVETGTHAELLAADGFYAALYNSRTV